MAAAVSINERDIKANTATVGAAAAVSVDEMNVEANTAVAVSVDEMNFELNTTAAMAAAQTFEDKSCLCYSSRRMGRRADRAMRRT